MSTNIEDKQEFTCAYCGKTVKGVAKYAIHRDGFAVGPEVPICNDCGSHPSPTCEEIWSRIAQPTNKRRKQ